VSAIVQARRPKVSFVVPCYLLGHLLGECVESILSQTYGNLEVLIMDDCSPDDTARVGQSFADARVRYIRNHPNLGHLRNYNHGIDLARGEYIWLISADDRLRRPYVVEKYVSVMEAHPQVGYACCPGVDIVNGKENGVGKYSVQASRDMVFRGHEFLRRLLEGNCVVAASGMVRRSVYEALGKFPLDLPYAGDWYLWSLFALHYDVAYFAEAMVNYRKHERSMTSELMVAAVRRCIDDDLAVLWRIKQKAEEAGFGGMAKRCRQAIAYEYASHVAGTKYNVPGASITLEQCESSLHSLARNPAEERWIRSRLYVFLGERYFRQQNFSEAQAFYRRGLSQDPRMVKAWIKRGLMLTGSFGIGLRRRAFEFRRTAAARLAGDAKRECL